MTKIIISAAPDSLNDFFSRKHWRERSIIVKDWHLFVRNAVQSQNIKPIEHYPVDIAVRCHYTTMNQLTGKRRRPLDTSNTMTALKLAEDGLVHAKILTDDGPKYVRNAYILQPKFRQPKNLTEVWLGFFPIKVGI